MCSGHPTSPAQRGSASVDHLGTRVPEPITVRRHSPVRRGRVVAACRVGERATVDDLHDTGTQGPAGPDTQAPRPG